MRINKISNEVQKYPLLLDRLRIIYSRDCALRNQQSFRVGRDGYGDNDVVLAKQKESKQTQQAWKILNKLKDTSTVSYIKQ